ncbi:MAG: hypothetical protein JXP34_25485 [Planctomycetes bacterium]|nr:hypothetical protein [Planctomycetota bacterium]
MAATGLAWGGYTVCRLLRDPRAARDWGFRCDTLPQASRAAALVFAAGALALGIVGATRGTLSLSPHLLACLAVYPAWGIAQQALLLGMGVRNIERWIRSRPALVTIGAG